MKRIALPLIIIAIAIISNGCGTILAGMAGDIRPYPGVREDIAQLVGDPEGLA